METIPQLNEIRRQRVCIIADHGHESFKPVDFDGSKIGTLQLLPHSLRQSSGLVLIVETMLLFLHLR